DNVLIEVLGEDGETYTDAGLVLNGTFEKQIVPPSEPGEPVEPIIAWTGYGYDVEETDTEVTISYEDIPAPAWWDLNAQLPVVDFDGTKGSIIFTFTGEDGHEYLFKIEGGGVAKELGITGNGLEQTLEIDLSDLTTAEREALSLIIVFVQTEAATGELVISPWEYGADAEEPAEPEEVWTGYGLTVVETETEVTISYENIPAPSWWDVNAQLPVVDFDGSKESIVFTFTGEDGHEYLFKIEGEGVAKELGITGNGSEQTLEIDLSDLTVAQREGLNLIIVFIQTEAATGDLVLSPWEYGVTS
ncbi:MAG: hypothetical protein ACLFRI_06730, partial [Candidatus Izemoplasmataceae bacterium]